MDVTTLTKEEILKLFLEQQALLNKLQQQVEVLLRKLYGTRSEKQKPVNDVPTDNIAVSF